MHKLKAKQNFLYPQFKNPDALCFLSWGRGSMKVQLKELKIQIGTIFIIKKKKKNTFQYKNIA